MVMNFSELESLLLSWPDELPKVNPSNNPNEVVTAVAVLIRSQDFQAAENLLLSALSSDQSTLIYKWLLAYLRLRQNQLAAAQTILKSHINSQSNQEVPFILIELQLDLGSDSQANTNLDAVCLKIQACKFQSAFLELMAIGICLSVGDINQADVLIRNFKGPDCLELHRFKARWLQAVGRSKDALNLLISALKRFPNHKALAQQLTILTIETKSASIVLPTLRHALHYHGEAPEFLGPLAQVKLIQREPSLARRSSLLDRTWASLSCRKTNITNQITSYEQCGNVSWFPFLLPHLRDPLTAEFANFELMSNLCCQYASLQSKLSHQIANAFIPRLAKLPGVELHSSQEPTFKSADKDLRIAWISGDLVPHPVSRFLLSFLEKSNIYPQIKHVVVGTIDHKDQSIEQYFSELPNVNVINLEHQNVSDRIAYVKDQKLDIAIDLSGWTGGNFQAGFLARLAPIQINYLGYFASTNNPKMDYWLGDEQLFPNPVTEIHSENIQRLKRCFLAWEPSHHFPEATEAVTPAPNTNEIRFGSFNHNRKLSDSTLTLWGKILTSITGSKLVLKANSSFDDGTQLLLRRRMQRNGLDPASVIWLPLTATTEEHLRQYSQIDISLDCFPNGGCTTTCEALWMGTPVITLTGETYVSRMSTAVLFGAGLSEWCTRSPQEYLDLAIAQANNLSWLRMNRDFWRNQILNNPLGDASDLMQNLCNLFYKLKDN